MLSHVWLLAEAVERAYVAQISQLNAQVQEAQLASALWGGVVGMMLLST